MPCAPHARSGATTSRSCYLLLLEITLHIVHPRSSRGVSGDDPEGGAGGGVPRSRLVTAVSEGSETARRALRPVLPGAGCTCSAGNGGAGNADPRPKIATVERREA